MSQAKVDKYKQEKANREKIMKKERLIKRIEITVCALICAGVVAWIGYSVYGEIQSSKAAETVAYTLDSTAMDDYISGLTTEE
ncbi:MAG: hypothetical protein PHC41_15840 [Lachnospiraceae bacterium]|nr:hypothetical protein [Lachnospiraceae bacterium]MDD3617662.1 hypothetical protein [Lachnospiraceae bacterium]